MNAWRRWVSCCFVMLVLVLMASGLPGCGRGGRIPAVPAGGTVSFRNRPLETGTITFVPASGRPAHGEIENGRFTMTTYSPGDGAVPGKHRVGVASEAIPERYSVPTSSGLVLDVPPGGNTRIVIAIP